MIIKMKSKQWILFITSGVLFLVLALALGLWDVSENKPQRIESVGEDKIAPPFTLLDLKGEKVNFADFRGKVILLNFWATWCPPCREEIPDFNELYNQYKKDGLEIVGISLDRGKPDEVRKFLAQRGVQYVNLIGTNQVLEGFNHIPGMGPIRGIPITFLIDRQGKISRRFVGLTPKRVFEEAIKPLF